jgi:hypothetical protein
MSEGHAPGRRSAVRRTNVTACVRCRSRKQRCDQNIPSCSNCERAGAECVSTDIDGSIAPRSYIKSLEDRVAHLETQLANANANANANRGLGGQLSSPDTAADPGSLHSFQSNSFASSIVAPPHGQSLLGSLLAGPIRSANTMAQASSGEAHRQTLLEELPYEPRAGLPSQDAATRLIEAYFEHCEFFCPIVPDKARFLEGVSLLYSAGSRSPPAHQTVVLAQFQTYIVFAVAVLLLNRTDSAFPVTRAEAYFAIAIRIMSQDAAAICTGDLDHLCNLLLVAQYSAFASDLSATWYFLGMASRLAVELGLHDERASASSSSSSSKLDEPQLSRQRWLFWGLYTSERNLCVVTGRPFSIPDEAIEAPLPELPKDDAGRAAALHLIRHRMLESEIYVTLHQRAPLNGATVDLVAWRENMQQRLLDWANAAPVGFPRQSTQLAPLGIFSGILNLALVHLYYPSPSFPSPTIHELAILAKSAGNAIRIYKETFRDGQLRFFWRTTHNLFRCGVAMAYCIHVQSTQCFPELSRPEMVASVNTCQSVLWAMVERYPAGKLYRDAFESLASSVLNPASSGSSGPAVADVVAAAFAYENAADLAPLSLPQTAVDTLYWGFGSLGG